MATLDETTIQFNEEEILKIYQKKKTIIKILKEVRVPNKCNSATAKCT
jgi:hypothetical protein